MTLEERELEEEKESLLSLSDFFLGVSNFLLSLSIIDFILDMDLKKADV